MENPTSWGPLERAMFDASRRCNQTTGVDCFGRPEPPLSLKASSMARTLVSTVPLKGANKDAAAKLIEQALELHAKGVEAGMAGTSDTKQVADALHAAGLVA